MQSGFDVDQLLQEAQKRWLKPAEVLFILQNHANYEITPEAPQKPSSGSLFLFNKRVLRFFRKDGHNWRKKKDGRTVGEAHERLKVGNAEALNCYYAHGEDNPNFQRRSYWMLDPVYEHIVLVHYREITEGKLVDLSPGPSATLSHSPSSYTAINQGSSSLSDFHESYQSHSSPVSIEVSSDATTGKEMDFFNVSNAVENVSELSESEVTQALRRLEVQLSLDDDNLKEYAPPDDQDINEDGYSVLVDQPYSRYTEMLSYSNASAPQQVSGGNKVNQNVPLGMEQRTYNGVSLSWDDVFGLSKDSRDMQTVREEVYSLNANGNKIYSSAGTAVQENHHGQYFGTNIGEKWTEASKDLSGLAYSSQIYSETSELSSMFLNPRLGMPLEEDSSLTVAKEQRFTITEISPGWGFTSDSTKVIIVGSFLSDPSDCVWCCMFGDIEVPLQIVQNGVLCCHAPPHSSGKVTLCITSGNRESCSEIREFEYREKHSTCGKCDKGEGETSRSTEEMLLLVRLVQMLLLNSSVQQGEINELGVDLSRKQDSEDDSWDQIIEALLVGGGTSSATLDWLLQQLLKDKLQQWLSLRSIEGRSAYCFLSRKEQGLIHMIAGLGYEWALSPLLECGVGVNFRDINGWTALHWAAKFGREKMVAALIASGASAVAVTDPSSQDPTGRNAAYIAAASGHKGLAGYLSEVALTSHLSSLTLEQSELSKGSADIEAELTVNNISKESVNSAEDQISMKHTLAAVRNSAQAAARIQAAFRAHSFRRRQHKEMTSSASSTSINEYGFTLSDIRGLSAATKLAFHHPHDHQNAALSIQKNYRSWKGRKDFLTLRQKVVKIQAHVRGFQVRKKYKVICWAVGILDKAVLRWRRKGVGLRGYKPEPECIDVHEDDDDIIKVFRKEKVNVAIDEAVSRVLSMVESPEARRQYNRVLGKFQEAKAERQGLTYMQASTSEDGVSNMDNDDYLTFP